MKKFRIYGNIASSKNGKIKTRKGLINNKTVQKCYSMILPQLEQIRDEFKTEIKSYPIKLHIYYYRSSKRIFDYINPTQTLQDAMVKAGLIEDDNTSFLIPIFEGHCYTSREQSGVEFWIN